MKIEKHIIVSDEDSLVALDCLADHTGLAKSRIKDAMSKGAVWFKRGKQTKRLRRAKTDLRPGDQLSVYYDEDILRIKPVNIECLFDSPDYSVWFKPAGILAQGTEWGDHLSLLKIAQQYKGAREELFVVHRLDREASGLMILAHTRRAAGMLSELFSNHKIEKRYRIEVSGDIRPFYQEHGGKIDQPLDEKEAVSLYSPVKFEDYTQTSVVDVRLVTGRKHQIRRHFAAIGFPVVGDPRYGDNNKNRDGLKLKAVSLTFDCPIFKEQKHFSV